MTSAKTRLIIYIRSKSEVDNFLLFILPRGTSENIFKIESLAQLNVWGEL